MVLKNATFARSPETETFVRGFGNYAFLTLDVHPRILKAKLKAGFPHVAIEVPVDAFENMDYHLCRYNVAMTRQLRRFGNAW